MKKMSAWVLLLALLLTGSALAACETKEPEESGRENLSSAVSVAGTSSPEASDPSNASEDSSETSPEAPEASEALTPLPEGLPESDSPAMPADARLYLPSGGYWENTGIDLPPLTVAFTYGTNTVVVEKTGDNGYSHRIEYRFDDRARLVEQSGSFLNGMAYSNQYTYDGAGRLTSLIILRRLSDDRVTERWDYAYGEDGALLREDYVLMDAEGETVRSSCEYLRTYDENGVLTKLVEKHDSGHTAEHFYKDGLERAFRYCDRNGEVSYAHYYDYDENGRLIRERSLSGEMEEVAVTSYFYEGDLPAEVREEIGGKASTLFRYVYDGDGRLLVEFGNDWSDSYDVFSYDERGSLYKVMGYRPEEGGCEMMKHCEVTAWGDEAATEMQLAFYRAAMSELFGGSHGSHTLEEQLRSVRLPQP